MNDKRKLLLYIFLIAFLGLTGFQMIGCIWEALWGGDLLTAMARLPYGVNLLVSAALAVAAYFILTGKGKR